MEQRLASELDAVRWHRVQLDRRLGGAKVPGRMVDLRAVEPGPVGRIEAVALDEEALQAPRRGDVRLAGRLVRGREGERPRGITPRTRVVDSLAAPVDGHARVVVRQLVEPARGL